MPPGTGMRAPGTASMRGGGLASRAGVGTRGGAAGEENRPMTAVRAAGYTATGRPGTGKGVFDPMGGGGGGGPRGPAPPLQKRADNSPEDKCREMEKEVNGLIEESAKLSVHKQYQAALDRAKEAGKLERQLCKKREEHGLADQINIDLTYSVCFNLANQYHCCGMYTEALNAYTLIVKNKQYAQSGRLRVNMGNIYYEQKKYSAAIKMYRMALDQIPNTGREIRYKIMRNIGNAFIRLGQFQDAIASFEQIMDGSADLQTGFNLVLCYYAAGEKERMKKAFARLVAVREMGMEDEDALAAELDDVLQEDGARAATRRPSSRADPPPSPRRSPPAAVPPRSLPCRLAHCRAASLAAVPPRPLPCRPLPAIRPNPRRHPTQSAPPSDPIRAAIRSPQASRSSCACASASR